MRIILAFQQGGYLLIERLRQSKSRFGVQCGIGTCPPKITQVAVRCCFCDGMENRISGHQSRLALFSIDCQRISLRTCTIIKSAKLEL